MIKSSPTVLCAVSHSYQSPWIDIWTEGQCLTWQTIPDTKYFQTINFFGTKSNRIIEFFDQLHEKIRWSNRYNAAILAFIDELMLWPLKSYSPIFYPINNVGKNHQTFEVRFPDTFLTYRWKLISLLRYFLVETNHDYLYLTTTSSYIRPNILLSRIYSLPSKKLYFGALAYDGADFVSGSSRLLSRDVVELVWNNRSKFSIGIIEDKALGQLLRKLSIEPEFIPIRNISSLDQIKGLKVSDFKGTFHFRMKSIENGVRIDASLMKALHNKINDLNSLSRPIN